MTAIENTPTNPNFLSPLNFKFSIKRAPHINFFIQKVSIPSINLPSYESPNPFVKIPEPGDHINYGDLEITFRVDEELKNWLEIQNWMRSNTNVEDFEEIQDANKWTSNATLLILNSAKNLKISVAFSNLFPISLSPIDFSSTIVDPEPFQASCTFSYRSYIVEIL
jgi:hypothetical protein